MQWTRRELLTKGAGAALAAGAMAGAAARVSAVPARFKLGVTDWNLRLAGRVEALALAQSLGFEGVQVSIGRGGTEPPAALPLADRLLQQAYLAESKRLGFPIASLCLDILHRHHLKNDPLGQRWVADAIPVATALGVTVILLPFFGTGALVTPAEMDYVGDALREVAPAAEKARVVLGLEDTISAKDNVRIMERAKSPAILTYYDVGNSTVQKFDVISEIRWLGKARICEMHLKDNPHYLGEGTIDFPGVVRAMTDIGFAEWAHLETDSPSKSIEADMRRNLGFVRDRIKAVV